MVLNYIVLYFRLFSNMGDKTVRNCIYNKPIQYIYAKSYE